MSCHDECRCNWNDTICEEQSTGERVSKNPFAHCAEDLDHASEEDEDGSCTFNVSDILVHWSDLIDSQNSTSIPTRSSPTHGNHGSWRGSQQETQQGDGSGIAECTAQVPACWDLWVQIELLEGISRNGEQDTLGCLDAAEHLSSRVVLLFADVSVGHDEMMYTVDEKGEDRKGFEEVSK